MDFGLAYAFSGIREAHKQDAQLVREAARSIWDIAVDCPEARSLPSVLSAAKPTKVKDKPRPRSRPELPSMKSPEANIKVNEKLRELKKKKGKISQRVVAEQITDDTGRNCSTGLVAKTLAWRAFEAERKRIRSPSAPKAISLTDSLSGVLGKPDETLLELIHDQERDAEPSPLDPVPGRQRRRRKQV
jgi:hypothetical protein